MHSKLSTVSRIFGILSLCLVVGYVFVSKQNTSTYIKESSVLYISNNYGFTLTLPLSWKGYSVITDTWKATPSDTQQVEVSGPLLSIRNPLWSTTTPRQDIPVMIFTLAEWNMLQEDKIHVGAAPVNPTELSRNTEYVFALPARYNFAYLPGYEEVETILQTKPLKGF